MILARVVGKATSTHKHPSLRGQRIIICQPIHYDGSPWGVPWLAVDPHGANLHQQVIISTDGSETRKYVNDEKTPLRNMIVALVDEEVGEK